MTQRQQAELEAKIRPIYEYFATSSFPHRAHLSKLWKHGHVEYLEKNIVRLPASFESLDASRPWVCYWIVHSLALLGEPVDDELRKNMIDFLRRCQDPLGGYGGGPGQMAHLATTYAAVCSLITIGGVEALGSINKEQVLNFLLRVKDPSGGFRLHEGGEMDMRGCYTALAVAYVLDILVPPLLHNVGQYLASLQTYEGGFAAEPGAEAHGGFSFLGLASAVLADEVDMVDLPALLHWIVFRQGKVEGGFQGRANKLVDACYSYWQGGVFPLLQQLTEQLMSQQVSGSEIMQKEHAGTHTLNWSDTTVPSDGETDTAANLFPCTRSRNPRNFPLFNSHALQAYLLLCCQLHKGGMVDKPGKGKDFYHTCYGLSGLSVAQHIMDSDFGITPPNMVFGAFDNLLQTTHPLLNIEMERYTEAYNYFHSALPSVAPLS